MKKWSRNGGLALLVASGIYFIGGCVQGVFYYPDSKDYGVTPESIGLKHEPVTFASRDGTRLTGWFIPAVGVDDPRQAKGTVIQVHGNAGNMTAHWTLVDWLPARGFNVFVFDYRGYGQSAGKPDQQGLFEDTQSAIDCARGRGDVDPQRLLILGQSLGGTNAIAAVGAGDRDGIRAMVIEATFYSYSKIASDKVPFTGVLFSNRYSAANYVARLAPIPVLFIHGTADRVVPYAHSEKLFAEAGEPKQLILIPGGDHIGAFVGKEGAPYRDAVIRFFEKALTGSGGG